MPISEGLQGSREALIFYELAELVECAGKLGV